MNSGVYKKRERYKENILKYFKYEIIGTNVYTENIIYVNEEQLNHFKTVIIISKQYQKKLAISEN